MSCKNKDLTVSKAAEILGISEAKLSQMRYTGTGPDFYKDNSGKVFYTPSAIKAYISQVNSTTKKRKAA